jgi:hypothetical protein
MTPKHKLTGMCAFLASLFLIASLHAQIVVTGTSFDPIPGNEGRTYIGLNDILHYGIQTGSITSTPPIAPNVNAGVFNANYYYAITDNPNKLDNTMYTNLATPDYQFVYSPRKPIGTNINILEYVVKGMLPGSAVSVTVQYCSVVSPSFAGCTGQRNEFKAGINLDASNQLNGTDATQIGMGECQSRTFTGTVAANGDMIFRMNATRDGCVAMGIRNIEVVGFIKPIALSNMGNEVCVGEQISLQPTQAYNASFQWQVRLGAGAWTNAPSGTNQSLLYEVTAVGTYQFRLNVTPLPSGTAVQTDPVTVTAITCCTVGTPPVSASRQTVYYDNFGRLNMNDKTGSSYFVWDYSNVLAPVEVARTTATPFRWPLTPAPLGATFVGAPGPLQDGQYAVAAFLTGYNYPINGYNGARLEWANRVKGLSTIPNPDQTYDFSGLPEGAALFLNCPVNTGGQTLYSRTINNLCFGKQLFFECWISVFTNSAAGAYNPVNILVRLTEVGNPTNFTTTTATATREADGGGVWVRVAGQINLVSGNSLLMEIVNNQNVSANGNDLVLDDIKIMACAPPAVNLYFDLPNLSETTQVCGADNLNLATKASALLNNFYGNAPRFLYQWTRTPANNNSWQNLGTPLVTESTTITNISSSAPFSGLADGGTVYFRVIAATAATYTAMNNFTAPNYANPNDPCKSYSVSDPIAATIVCPLPVHLNYFKGWSTEDKNELEWATSNEVNNDYFIVQKSADGIFFSDLKKVEGNGNSSLLHIYRCTDENPFEGTTYYRLKQIDIDGTEHRSNTISIERESSLAFTVYPNPTAGSFSVDVSSKASEFTLQILDIQGKELSMVTDSKTHSIHEFSGLPSGVYFVRVKTDSNVQTKKLVVY